MSIGVLVSQMCEHMHLFASEHQARLAIKWDDTCVLGTEAQDLGSFIMFWSCADTRGIHKYGCACDSRGRRCVLSLMNLNSDQAERRIRTLPSVLKF